MKAAAALVAALSLAGPLTAGNLEDAERLAAEAVELIGTDPAAALERARRALELTASFDPTTFVSAGRKGELVEDAFVQARSRYRAHRAGLYAAAGRALAAQQRHAAATRYLRRAALLDPGAAPSAELAFSLASVGRGWDALALLLAAPRLTVAELAAADAVADQLRLPSLQAELDARRLSRRDLQESVSHRSGPLRLPPAARLSTGQRFVPDPRTTLFYVADSGCRTCSSDFEALARADLPVVVLPPARGDEAVRRILRVYGYAWPFLLDVDAARDLRVTGPAVLLAAREGWSNAVVRPPLAGVLPIVLEVMDRQDVRERRPRSAWSGRDVDRVAPVAPPGLLENGLAPGEDVTLVPELVAAITAFRAGRFTEAQGLFEEMERDEDGYLLPPEARYNQALCLARAGRADAARRLLLRIGDSRFQDAVDAALESAGSW